jgi:hypothetical protein
MSGLFLRYNPTATTSASSWDMEYGIRPADISCSQLPPSFLATASGSFRRNRLLLITDTDRPDGIPSTHDPHHASNQLHPPSLYEPSLPIMKLPEQDRSPTPLNTSTRTYESKRTSFQKCPGQRPCCFAC